MSSMHRRIAKYMNSSKHQVMNFECLKDRPSLRKGRLRHEATSDLLARESVVAAGWTGRSITTLRVRCQRVSNFIGLSSVKTTIRWK